MLALHLEGQGGRVVVHSVRTQPELNGRQGMALRYSEERRRWIVHLDGDINPCMMLGKNLAPLDASGEASSSTSTATPASDDNCGNSSAEYVPKLLDAAGAPATSSCCPASIARLLVVVCATAILALLQYLSSVPRPPPAAPSTINDADTSWMLSSSAAVLLMIPALGLFEAGLLRSVNAVSVLVQCFAGAAVAWLLWVLVGFSLCFAHPDRGLYGDPAAHWFLRNISYTPLPDAAPTIPAILFAAFEGMFAAITPLLCTGAFAERLRFDAFVLFVVLWSILVYYPLCHWVWGGGWLARWGVYDFAGGIVIHTSAGAASLVSAMMLGPRARFADADRDALAPHNLPMAASGAGLLWFGWFSFNGGSALKAGALASTALMNTQLGAAGGTLAWLALDWTVHGRTTLVGVLNGALSGLAGITPAAGFVPPSAGLVIGVLCGLASYSGVLLLKERLRIDDALDVSSVHGITGALGSVLIGVYASSAVNSAGPDASLDLLLRQLVGVLVAIGWSSTGTLLIFGTLLRLMSGRIEEEHERIGLDALQHGESAYHRLVLVDGDDQREGNGAQVPSLTSSLPRLMCSLADQLTSSRQAASSAHATAPLVLEQYAGSGV